jgi:hypothetical protein
MQFRPVRIAALTSCLLLLIPYAQSQNPTGSLRGEVQDSSGARLVGAQITVQSAESSFTRKVVADNRGEFRIEGLLPGAYHVVAAAKGFADAASDVNIAVTLVRDITVTLKPASGHETVAVQATTSSITTQTIDTSSAVRGGVVGTQDLETMPAVSPTLPISFPEPSPSSPPIPLKRASPPSLLAEAPGSTTYYRSTAPTTPTTGLAASCRISHPTAFRNLPYAPRTRTPTPVGAPPGRS